MGGGVTHAEHRPRGNLTAGELRVSVRSDRVCNRSYQCGDIARAVGRSPGHDYQCLSAVSLRRSDRCEPTTCEWLMAVSAIRSDNHLAFLPIVGLPVDGFATSKRRQAARYNPTDLCLWLDAPRDGSNRISCIALEREAAASQVRWRESETLTIVESRCYCAVRYAVGWRQKEVESASRD